MSDGPARARLTAAAEAHLAAGLPAVERGDFTTDHWLATFAALALDPAGDAVDHRTLVRRYGPRRRARRG
ncbi:DUF2891 family protein [Streptomyces sp. DHE17-7]|uniref:DUF2891 family protein n=1 Tax=Streptomyces sp. DHE17-7 TaxID=2759949 RepID=UPI003FA6D3CC